jgi:formate hydrogenlyase subunit 4
VRLAAFGGLFLVLLAETGRLPVDNPDTHLELTMIHEATLLEYAGPPLAVVSVAVWVKQLVAIAMVADLALPWGMGSGAGAVAWALGKWGALALALGVAESLTAKLRFFHIPGYLGASFAFSVSALLLQVVGVR